MVSDLHVGIAARGVDLNPRPAEAKYAEKAYIETFEQFVASRSLRADFLVVPGDVTNTAAADEFRLASTAIARVASALSVPDDHILFVPGNHDVDWKVLSIDPQDRTDFRLRQRYQPLEQPECIFSAILGRTNPNRITQRDCFSLWTFPDALVVGLNSAYHDGPDDKVHHGLIPQHALDSLEETLRHVPWNEDQFRLAIVHHHPVQYSDPIPNEPDFSAMTNAAAMLRVLEEHQFDLVIHGHKHVPTFSVWQVSSYFQLPILGAGSFSYMLDPRWSGLVNNQFHIVNIDRRDTDTSRTLGVLKSFTYLCGHGWRDSQPNNGIEHEIFFGGFSSEATLKPALRTAVSNEFASSTLIRLHTFLSTREEFRYVASKLLIRVLKILASEIGFVILGSELNSMVLLKE